MGISSCTAQPYFKPRVIYRYDITNDKSKDTELFLEAGLEIKGKKIELQKDKDEQ